MPLYLNPDDRNNVTSTKDSYDSILTKYTNHHLIIFIPKDFIPQDTQLEILSFLEHPLNRMLRILNESPTGLPKAPLEDCLATGCAMRYGSAVSESCYRESCYQFTNHLLVPYDSILELVKPLSLMIQLSENEILSLLTSEYSRTNINHVSSLRRKYIHDKTAREKLLMQVKYNLDFFEKIKANYI